VGLDTIVTTGYNDSYEMRKKYPSQLNTGVVRINIGRLSQLKEIAKKLDVSIADALELMIAERAEQYHTRISPQQIPIPTMRLQVKTARVIDGDTPRQIAHVIKPKGGHIDG
jgi:hypothetical protein